MYGLTLYFVKKSSHYTVQVGRTKNLCNYRISAVIRCILIKPNGCDNMSWNDKNIYDKSNFANQSRNKKNKKNKTNKTNKTNKHNST